MTLTLRRFEAADAAAWDAFCGACLQATFLHSRRFLSYHGDRFEDASLVIEDDGEWVGAFPAALNPGNAREVVSHPGLTYGGVLHQGSLRGERMIEVLDAMRHFYGERGCERLVYKVVPFIYHRVPSQDDLYALFRLGAVRTRCDLSGTIDLARRLPVTSRRARGLKRAIRNNVEIATGPHALEPLWHVLADNLRSKFDAEPVHSLQELALLAGMFPDEIRCVCGTKDGRVIAGVVLFETSSVSHAQYIASSEAGQDMAALDLVFDFCIRSAAERGKTWFDFGTSNEDGGRFLNGGLYEFKSSFGGGGVAHEFYTLQLTGETDAH